jgi:formate dehydrogenase major subunit
MGSNMAEAHPVGFQWVMEARNRGAEVIHVDPRFSRTSANATRYVGIRPGTDIAFLGGIIRHILENELDFREYVQAYTNARVIIAEEFRDTEDLDGLFSGFEADSQSYTFESWQYEGLEMHAAAGQREHPVASAERHGGHGGLLTAGEAPSQDPTLQHPRCVYQLLRRHFQRYTPEKVAATCGCRPEEIVAVAEALARSSGRERTSAICYAVGWTQHTVGVQYIRAASIIQLLLGNIGRPGGGILALRGHASIQGSTDVPTLFDLLPGYLPMPHAHHHESLQLYLERNGVETGFWADMDAYMVSLLKAWWGDHATGLNDYCFGYLPHLTGDHSAYQTMFDMLDGKVKGYFLMGENPAVGSANGGLQRRAMARLDWLVVRDMVEVESASFWYEGPEIETGELRPEDIGTEVFLLPAAAHTEKEGSFTNTQRLLQWRHKAVEPPQDARSELWFVFHLGRIIREKLLGSTLPRDRGVLNLTWDYPTRGPTAEPSAEAVLHEINGHGPDGPLSTYTELKNDGSTSCGVWIYCGVGKDGINQAARRTPGSKQTWVAPEWGWAWPANRRLLYNRASADPEGKPWSERKKYVWWDEQEGAWTGEDVPDFTKTKRPDYLPPEGARGDAALKGTDPFVMQSDGLGWLFVPEGVVDGPFPTHYEPQESPVENAFYTQQANPVRGTWWRRENPYNPSGGRKGSTRYPFVLTTYRVTEHHTAGGMTRTLPVLSELQPELFCEVSPELAALRKLEHGGWATIVTTRTAIEARVLVTGRMSPLQVNGHRLHQVGVPYHWGYHGLVTGDVVNDLFPIVADPNVRIQESKVATCDILPGRRPRGPALLRFVQDHQPAEVEAAG